MGVIRLFLDSDGDTYDDKTEVAHNSNPSILQIYHLFQRLIYFSIYPLTVKLRIYQVIIEKLPLNPRVLLRIVQILTKRP